MFNKSIPSQHKFPSQNCQKKSKYCPFSEMYFKSEWSRIILNIMLFKQEYIFFQTPKIVLYNCTLFYFYSFRTKFKIKRDIGTCINIPSVIQFCFEFSTKIVTIINDFTSTEFISIINRGVTYPS